VKLGDPCADVARDRIRVGSRQIASRTNHGWHLMGDVSFYKM
jgi:hypothetical protein